MNVEKMTIKEIKAWLEQVTDQTELKALYQDQRSGVRKLAERWEQEQQKKKEAYEHWRHMNQHERELRQQGYVWIAGVDEVGRGPIAGPLVVSAVILPATFELVGINDSKQLSKERREAFAAIIKEQAVAYSVVYIDAQEIDRINIYQATLKGMVDAIASLSVQADFALVDAMKPDLTIPYRSIIKGDATSASIAAASIVAKVERDRWMEKAASLYPHYGFERNAGYATKEHLAALNRYGYCELHRQTFLRPEQLTLPLNF